MSLILFDCANLCTPCTWERMLAAGGALFEVLVEIESYARQIAQILQNREKLEETVKSRHPA